MRAPPGYEVVRGPRATAFALPDALAWVADALEGGALLRDAAARHPDVRTMSGRGAVYAVPVGVTHGVVRPYRRGGLVAGPLLGDRYLRLGEPRPLREARASLEVRGRGIPTPRVLAGAVYPAGPFYRADLVTELVPDARELAEAALGDEGAARVEAFVAAGTLVGRMASAGVAHPDLNARNIVLVADGGALSATLLDLDRCRARAPGSSASAGPMLERLERSLAKIARTRGVELPGEALRALRDAAAAGA